MLARAILAPMIRGTIVAQDANDRLQVAIHEAPTGMGDAVIAAADTDGLADVLAAILPTGSRVVVRWRDAESDDGLSVSAGAPNHLHDHAIRCLDGRMPATSVTEIASAWQSGQTRIAIAARLSEALSSESKSKCWVCE